MFELWNAIKLGRDHCDIQIILAPEDKNAFRDRINADGSDAWAIDEALANVKSEEAEAFSQDDLCRIHTFICSLPGGFATLDSTIKHHLRRWFVSQGGVKVVARAGHRNGASRSRSAEQSRPSSNAQADSGGLAASTPPHVAAVGVGPAPGDDGLTGFELPDATDDDGDEYLDVDGASIGFGFTVLPRVNGSSEMEI